MPKILWMSPYSLHDTSSGASVDAKDMLESLVKRGFQVWSCASFVFDNEAGTVAFGDLRKTLAESKENIFILDDKGIHYVYTRCQSRSRSDFTLKEGELFYNTYLKVLDEFKPDIVFGYGLGMESMAAWAEARRRGISTVYLLVNGNHGNFSFPNTDLVITDSQATSKLYAERDQINVIPTGAFFMNRERYYSKKRSPKYVTLVNPSPAKGISIFTRLVDVCQKELPDVKFLVVNSRASFKHIVPALYEQDDHNKHPYANFNFSNVDTVESQVNMAPVYELTKVLVAPSLWFESWGRVTSEAVINGIPVLGSSSGGISEAIGGCAGIILDAPKALVEDYCALPTYDEIRPWVDALKRLLNEDWSENIQKAQQQLDHERSTDRVIEVFRPLFEKAVNNTNTYYN